MCCSSEVEGRHGSDVFFVVFVLKVPCPCFGLDAMVSPVDFVTKVTQQFNLKSVVDNTNVASQLEGFVKTA